MKVLVTGSAGFIGSHVVERLLARGDEVLGFDSLNAYYDVQLKQARLDRLRDHPRYRHVTANLADQAAVSTAFERFQPEAVVHLAAQAGVRYAMENPHAYVESNLVGFQNMLESVRKHAPRHFVFASSSSVYGAGKALPYREDQCTDHPLTLYAATKKANEVAAHAYAHLFCVPSTGLRFFTVYGPRGRPDMAFFKFVRAMLADEEIPVFNHGHHSRDFTYIDDVVDIVVAVLDRPAKGDPTWDPLRPNPSTSSAPYRILNVGGARPVPLLRAIEILEQELGRRARLRLLPMQPGDVPDTSADTAALERLLGRAPSIPIEVGIPNFVRWYRDYFRA
jgi:UDP-glucuronate 4-epimerase